MPKYYPTVADILIRELERIGADGVCSANAVYVITLENLRSHRPDEIPASYKPAKKINGEWKPMEMPEESEIPWEKYPWAMWHTVDLDGSAMFSELEPYAPESRSEWIPDMNGYYAIDDTNYGVARPDWRTSKQRRPHD